MILAGCHPAMQEYFTPQGKHKPYEACMREVDTCDAVIAIVAHRYGWVPVDQPGADTKSITWLECERAKEVIACVVDEKHPWPLESKESYRMSAAIEAGTDTPELQLEVRRNVSRLKDFKKWLGSHGVWWEFTSPDHLATGILKALSTAGAADDPTSYLATLRDHTAWIDIRGLHVGSGKAYRFPIQDLYIPLTTAGGGRNVPLEDALKRRRVVIVGDPGSGKTTFLRRLAFEACGATGKLAMSEVGFPILIRISQLEEHIANCTGRKHEGIPTFQESPDWLPHFLAAQKYGLNADFFDKKMHEEQTIVLLDGLDEVPDTRSRERIARLFEKAIAHYRECRFVVTTRPGAYQGMATLGGFDEVKIDNLGDEAVEGFLRHWAAGLHPTDETAANGHLEELVKALRARPAIRRMARNPVMLTALAVVHWNERRMPEQRAELYESILMWLAKARENPDRVKAERCLTLLGHLALCMQKQPRGRVKQIGKRKAAELIAPQMRDVPAAERIGKAEEFLEKEEVDSGIVVSRNSKLEFWHLTFQEHLAGRALAGLTDAAQEKLLFKGANLYKPEWRETVLLYAGLLGTKQGPEKVDALVSLMLDRQGTTLTEQARCAGLLGSILADLKASGYQVQDSRYPELLKAVMAIFDREQADSVPLKIRLEAADALGQAGDPRLREDNWVTIPGSKEVRAFQIARFPVTVEEYGRFVDDGGSAPSYWEDQVVHPNHPVVNLSWFEAAAYCSWFGGRLPVDAEWEQAARGAVGRTYPWGEEPPDPTRANYRDAHVKGTSPVGLFPSGATPEGIEDMAGNVWEWVAAWYTQNDSRALRGGGWHDVALNLRAAYRVGCDPGYKDGDIGFRCAREVSFP